MTFEADIINDCIKVFNENKEEFLINLNIIETIDTYYDNYKDITNNILTEFIKFTKNKLNVIKKTNYNISILENWFYSDEFKNKLINLRDPSNLEYYLYITNKNNKNKIKLLEKKINLLLLQSWLYMIIIIIYNLFN